MIHLKVVSCVPVDIEANAWHEICFLSLSCSRSHSIFPFEKKQTIKDLRSSCRKNWNPLYCICLCKITNIILYIHTYITWSKHYTKQWSLIKFYKPWHFLKLMIKGQSMIYKWRAFITKINHERNVAIYVYTITRSTYPFKVSSHPVVWWRFNQESMVNWVHIIMRAHFFSNWKKSLKPTSTVNTIAQ